MAIGTKGKSKTNGGSKSAKGAGGIGTKGGKNLKLKGRKK